MCVCAESYCARIGSCCAVLGYYVLQLLCYATLHVPLQHTLEHPGAQLCRVCLGFVGMQTQGLKCYFIAAGSLPDHVQPQGFPPVPEEAVLGHADSVQQWCLVLPVCCYLHTHLHCHPPGTLTLPRMQSPVLPLCLLPL